MRNPRERSPYYDPRDQKKVKKVYSKLLHCKVLNNGKNLNRAVRKIVLAVRVFLKKPELLLLDEDFLVVDALRNRTIYGKFW